MGHTGPRAVRGHASSHLDDSRSPTPSSQNSGSTYYVVPTPGQKVRVVVSLHTRFCTLVYSDQGVISARLRIDLSTLRLLRLSPHLLLTLDPAKSHSSLAFSILRRNWRLLIRNRVPPLAVAGACTGDILWVLRLKVDHLFLFLRGSMPRKDIPFHFVFSCCFVLGLGIWKPICICNSTVSSFTLASELPHFVTSPEI
jgi:hypothetical protein